MSQQTVTGAVSMVSAKNWTSPQGEDIVLYSFQVAGDKRYFRTGTTKPAISEQDNIRFVFETQGNKVDLDSIEAVDSAAVQQAPKPPAAGGDSREEYWAKKDAHMLNVVEPRINFSASQRDAIALVTAALEQDCLSFGTTAKGKKLDMLLEFVDQVTDRFVEQRLATGND